MATPYPLRSPGSIGKRPGTWDDSGEGCSVHGRPVDLASVVYLLLLMGFLLLRRR